MMIFPQFAAKSRNSLQMAAIRCNLPQFAAIRCNLLQFAAKRSESAKRCKTPQFAVIRCESLFGVKYFSDSTTQARCAPLFPTLSLHHSHHTSPFLTLAHLSSPPLATSLSPHLAVPHTHKQNLRYASRTQVTTTTMATA